MSLPHSSRFSTTSTTGRFSASAVSMRLSAMNRRASRRCGESSSGVTTGESSNGTRSRCATRCAISATRCGGHDLADQRLDLVAALGRVLAGLEAEPHGQRARDRAVGVRVLVRDAREHQDVRVRRSARGRSARRGSGSCPCRARRPPRERELAVLERLVGQLLDLADRGGPPRELRLQVVRRSGRDDGLLAFALAKLASPRTSASAPSRRPRPRADHGSARGYGGPRSAAP